MPESDELKALRVLAAMYFSMGREESAGRLYRGIMTLSGDGREDKGACAGLAAVALEKGDGAAALEYLAPLLKNAAFSSRQAVFFLMKAQALWLEKRRTEARAALNEYLLFAAGKKEGA